MPVSFLSTAQPERYSRYPESRSPDELARYFRLHDDDHEWIATKRRDSDRLGYALQLTTVRFLGAFLEDPTAVPTTVLQTLSSQLNVADPDECIIAYRATRQRWPHTPEIRERYGNKVQLEDETRLSPFGHEHINMLGRYSFSMPEPIKRGELLPLTTGNDL